MAKKKDCLDERFVPLDSVLYALERTTDYLRADYASGVASCDPVEDCFASVYETLVRDVLENDEIDEKSRSAFAQRLAKTLAEYFENLER